MRRVNFAYHCAENWVQWDKAAYGELYEWPEALTDGGNWPGSNCFQLHLFGIPPEDLLPWVESHRAAAYAAAYKRGRPT